MCGIFQYQNVLFQVAAHCVSFGLKHPAPLIYDCAFLCQQWLQEPLKSTTGVPGASVPSGAWAKKVGTGSSVPIKSADDSDIQLSLADCMGTL